jgi:hypothetical protein
MTVMPVKAQTLKYSERSSFQKVFTLMLESDEKRFDSS